MTEVEARKKWCPFVRVSAGGSEHIGNVSVNRWDGFPLPQNSYCIASDCAVWRWEHVSDYQVFTDNNGNFFEANSNDRLNEAKKNQYKKLIPEHGECGLAR